MEQEVQSERMTRSEVSGGLGRPGGCEFAETGCEVAETFCEVAETGCEVAETVRQGGHGAVRCPPEAVQWLLGHAVLLFPVLATQHWSRRRC